MVRIAVAGAAGRMGSRIAALSQEYPGLQLAGAFERRGHKDIGKDVGPIVGVGSTGILLSDSLEAIIESVDLVISFTTVEASLEHLRLASASKKAMVIGTTGFSKENLAEVAALTKTIPCVMASNMSTGVNLLLKVLQDIARVLGEGYDVEIIEAHNLFSALGIPHPDFMDFHAGAFFHYGAVWDDPAGRDVVFSKPPSTAWRGTAGLSLIYRPGLPDPRAQWRIQAGWPVGPEGGVMRFTLSIGREFDLVTGN